MPAFRQPAPKEVFFSGLPGDPRLGEWVTASDKPEGQSGKPVFVLYGSPDDTGVRINRGRPGAADGPNSIRKYLYKMAPPLDFDLTTRAILIDLGNCLPREDIRQTHANTQQLSEIAGPYCGISLGGGHDFAAPSFRGFAIARTKSKKTRLGLINIDAHLDVREYVNGHPHSGTPFRELIEQKYLDPKRFVEFGIRKHRNSSENAAYCRKKGVAVHYWDEICEKGDPVDRFKKVMRSLSSRCDFVGLTIDMDCCAEAEGTSAAPVLGFSAMQLVRMARIAGCEPKVQHLEIAEVAPPLDFAERSSRIAAEILYAFIVDRTRASTKSKK